MKLSFHPYTNDNSTQATTAFPEIIYKSVIGLYLGTNDFITVHAIK